MSVFDESFKAKALNYFTAIVVAIVLVGGLAIAYDPWQRGKKLQREEKELLERIEAKKAEIARLKDYQRRFREDPDFIEKIARQNRRVYPGELVFIFND